MKRFYQFLPLAFLPAIIIFIASSSGSPGGKSGSPGDSGATCNECHSGTPQTAANWITTNIPEIGYVGGQTYTITATGTHTGANKFGFELTAEGASGDKVGTFTITNATETKLVNNNKAVTHKSAGNTPTGGVKTWSFDWTAPEGSTGDVTFYAAFNGANGNGTNTGDQIYTTSHTVGPDVTGIEDLANKFRFYPNPSTGVVNFELPGNEKASEIEVYSINGQTVASLNLQNDFRQADLSYLTKGVYFVRLSGSGESSMQKLVIN